MHTEVPEITEIPTFFDSEDQLRKLKAKDFPKSKAGKLAYCDYMIEKWKIKKLTVEVKLDPLTKKRAKKKKLETELQRLIAELEEAENGQAKGEEEEEEEENEEEEE